MAVGAAQPGRAFRLSLGAMTPFVSAALIALVGVALFGIVVGYQVGGEHGAEMVEDVAPPLAALIAAAISGFTAWRSLGRRRLAWSLIGASALIWGAGGVVTAIYELALNRQPPTPSIADASSARRKKS